MSKYTIDKGLITLTIIFIVWRLFLFIPIFLGEKFIAKDYTFAGEIPWANFDGMHYLSIAERGYKTYQQAFFPSFPLLIKTISPFFDYHFASAGLIIVHISLFLSLVFFYYLIRLDYDRKVALWSIVFFLSFPTAFFLISIYTESLFLALALGSFYASRRKRWLIAGLLGIFASSTRLVGIFLFPALIVEFFSQSDAYRDSIVSSAKAVGKKAWGIFLVPFGLLAYMFYLTMYPPYDPIAFIHSQPYFGAGRSGGGIVLLPQVLFRYIKIFITVPLSNYDYWIALLEAFVFIIVILILFFGYRKGVRKSYIIFSAIAIVAPTLSGTFSSIPRYSLAAFAIFIFFGMIKHQLARYVILVVGLILEVALSMLFLRGHFVS